MNDWTLIEIVNYWQRKIIVWSILYYQWDVSLVTDRCFDEKSKLLVKLQSDLTKDELLKTTYGYVMLDFDGSTGFDLRSRLTKDDRVYLDRVSRMVEYQCEQDKNRNEESKCRI